MKANRNRRHCTATGSVAFLFILCSCPFLGLAQAPKWHAWVAEADTLMQQEAFENARKLYTKALESMPLNDPDAYDILYKRATCNYYLEQYEQALADVQKFIEKYPSVSQAKLLRTFIYGEMDATEEQLKSLNELVATDPFNADLVKWQGSVLLEADRYEEARERLKYATLLRNDPETATYLGLAYYHLDDPDSALIQLDKAIAMDKTYLPAYFYASSLCIDQSACELALVYLDKALALNSDDLTLIFYKGVALAETGKTEEGCRYLSKAFYGGNDDAGDYLEKYCFK